MTKIAISRSQLEKLLGEAYDAGWLGSKDMKTGAVKQILDSWEHELNFEPIPPRKKKPRKSDWENPWMETEDRLRYLAPTLEDFASQYHTFSVGDYFESADDADA